VDPIGMAAIVIMAGKTIVPTRVNPLDPAIVAFASVNGGKADNVIPEEVILTGTIRTLKPEMRRKLAGVLEETAWGVARISGVRCDLSVEMQYPTLFNHPQMVEEFSASAARIVLSEKVIRLQAPSMTGEDVSYFHRKVPGVHWQNETIHTLYSAKIKKIYNMLLTLRKFRCTRQLQMFNYTQL
jgi:metal-dependent amidase/aminoacylase/carboxypeptidase family protein